MLAFHFLMMYSLIDKKLQCVCIQRYTSIQLDDMIYKYSDELFLIYNIYPSSILTSISIILNRMNPQTLSYLYSPLSSDFHNPLL